jgi:hypothetical protein
MNRDSFTGEMTGGLCPWSTVKKIADHLPLQTGARNLRGDPMIHLALAEFLEKTAGEWMTGDEGNVMWVSEKIDVSKNSWTV